MVFEPDDETLSILASSVRDFVTKEIEPIASKIDDQDFFPLEAFKKMGKMGYLGITVPTEYGGSGLNLKAQAIIEDQLGYSSPSVALSYGAHSNLCLDNLYRNGSSYIRKNFVPKLASGEWIGSLGLTEPGSGSDALAMKTQAKKVEKGYVLNGSKTLITNAPFSDLFLVYARTEDKYSAFVVLSSDKGFSRGKKFSKMGMRGSPTGEIFFDEVELGEERLVGDYGGGKDIILSGLNSERTILSFIFIGLARRALETAIEYSTQRKQFNMHLYRFELIEEKLAYMFTGYETSKILAEKALMKLEKDPMDSLYAASAIMHATESAEFIAREAIQILGGIGYTKETIPERLLRDAILGQIGAGTTEIRKHLISSALVKSFKKDPNMLN